MAPDSIGEYYYLVLSSLYRYESRVTVRAFLRQYLAGEGFTYIFWMRTCAYLGSAGFLRRLFFWPAFFMLRRWGYKLGISIPWRTVIGPGFFIGHFSGIVVGVNAVIGKNCNISQCVTIGRLNRGERKGSPVIGDDVYIGPGAVVVGKVVVGNRVAVGANCVVMADIPDGGVVVGVPGRVISSAGSAGYVGNTDYDRLLRPV